MSVNEELRFVNAMIGFSRPSGGTWPAPVEAFDYLITGIEMGVEVVVEKDPRSPTPELILSSSVAGHSILMEAKTTTVSTSQAHAYQHIHTATLVNQGLAAPNMREETAIVDVIYMCAGDNLEKLDADMGRSNCCFPIVSHTDSRFFLGSGEIKFPPVHAVFAEGISVSDDAWPTHFVRCDRNSTAAQLASVVMSEVVRQLIINEFVTVETVCAAAVDFWDRRGPDDKKQISKRVLEVVSDASLSELSDYLERDDRDKRKFLLNRSLSSRALDRLSDVISEFVERLQQGRPFAPDQPPLFSFAEQT